jgi:hypothetical protein
MKIIVCSVSVLGKIKAAGLQELIYGFLELGSDEAKRLTKIGIIRQIIRPICPPKARYTLGK